MSSAITAASSTADSPSQPLVTQSVEIASRADFSVETCTAQSLADALIAARGKAEASRLLQEASKIADAHDTVMVSPNEKRNTCIKKDNTTTSDLLGKPLLSAPIETSFLSPRMGKFTIMLHENGLLATKTNDPTVQLTLLKDTKAEDEASCGRVSHVLLFPKPEDCKAIVYNSEIDQESKPKKVGGNLVFLYLASELQIPKQKSPTQQLCFALPSNKKLGKPIGPALADEEDDLSCPLDPTQAWGYLLQKTLGGTLAQVLGPQNRSFESYQAPNTSTTTAGMPYVSCYLGVNDGVLYPLEEGLLFYKPPRFLPRSNLHSIACGRGGGGGDASSRYVDMVVQCSSSSNNDDDKENSEETVEFTNIQREENSVLNSYIHDVLVPAMKRDAANATSNKADDENDDDDDDETDEVQVEAVVADDETEEEDSDEEANGESDSDDEDFDEGNVDGSDDDTDEDEDEDDDIDYGEDDEGVAVVKDDFAQELVNERRRKKEEESATESESEDSEEKPRFSKRLRRTGA